jgi:hypothetical protein
MAMAEAHDGLVTDPKTQQARRRGGGVRGMGRKVEEGAGGHGLTALVGSRGRMRRGAQGTSRMR